MRLIKSSPCGSVLVRKIANFDIPNRGNYDICISLVGGADRTAAEIEGTSVVDKNTTIFRLAGASRGLKKCLVGTVGDGIAAPWHREPRGFRTILNEPLFDALSTRTAGRNYAREHARFVAALANAATAVGAALTLVTLHLHRRRLRTFMHVRPARANIYREHSRWKLSRSFDGQNLRI